MPLIWIPHIKEKEHRGWSSDVSVAVVLCNSLLSLDRFLSWADVIHSLYLATSLMHHCQVLQGSYLQPPGPSQADLWFVILYICC